MSKTPSIPTIVDKHLGTRLLLLGSLEIIHDQPPPPPLPKPQTRLDGCIQNFSGISTLYRVGGGRTTRYFWKVALFYDSTQITENHKYCIAVPRTFFLDCRFCYSWEFHEWKFICYIFIHFFFFFFCHQNSALGECSLTIIGSQCDWGCESES